MFHQLSLQVGVKNNRLNQNNINQKRQVTVPIINCEKQLLSLTMVISSQHAFTEEFEAENVTEMATGCNVCPGIHAFVNVISCP